MYNRTVFPHERRFRKCVAAENNASLVMQDLQFDPLVELVDMYAEVIDQLDRQREIRDGIRQDLSTTGKPKAYRIENTLALMDKAITIGKELMPYKYGKVPTKVETGEGEVPPLIIQVTT